MARVRVKGTTTCGIIYDSNDRKYPKCGSKCLVDSDIQVPKEKQWNYEQCLDVELRMFPVVETCPECGNKQEYVIQRAIIHK